MRGRGTDGWRIAVDAETRIHRNGSGRIGQTASSFFRSGNALRQASEQW
jgi:hypothetical protein